MGMNWIVRSNHKLLIKISDYGLVLPTILNNLNYFFYTKREKGVTTSASNNTFTFIIYLRRIECN